MQWQNSARLKEFKFCSSKAKKAKELNVLMCFTSSTVRRPKKSLRCEVSQWIYCEGGWFLQQTLSSTASWTEIDLGTHCSCLTDFADSFWFCLVFRALADVMRPQGPCTTDHMERDLNIVVHVQHYENMETRPPANNLRKLHFNFINSWNAGTEKSIMKWILLNVKWGSMVHGFLNIRNIHFVTIRKIYFLTAD